MEKSVFHIHFFNLLVGVILLPIVSFFLVLGILFLGFDVRLLIPLTTGALWGLGYYLQYKRYKRVGIAISALSVLFIGAWLTGTF